MSKIVIVGGKLQGLEAVYLAKEAGFETILIDKNPDAIACKLCDIFICADILSEDEKVIKAMEDADMILPAMENEPVLYGLTELCRKKGYVLAFDYEAYRISSSKKLSDKMFADNSMPAPRYYPEGDFPYIAKPDAESGSHGVRIINDEKEMEEFLMADDGSYIIQEFVEGPSYSVEVIGTPGNYRAYEITQIFVDDIYDCNLAATYRTIEPELKKEIEKLAVKTAEIMHLKGIMDLEVIDCKGMIKILETDARLPSQTPIVVYHASGMNYISELYNVFCDGTFRKPLTDTGAFASLAHYEFKDGVISSHGEHIMTEGRTLNITEGVCEDVKDIIVISDYYHSSMSWRGTFINRADTPEELMSREKQMLEELQAHFGNLKGEKHDHIFIRTEAEAD